MDTYAFLLKKSEIIILGPQIYIWVCRVLKLRAQVTEKVIYSQRVSIMHQCNADAAWCNTKTNVALQNYNILKGLRVVVLFLNKAPHIQL